MPLIVCNEKPFTPPVVNGHTFEEREDGTWGAEVADKFLPMFGIGFEGAPFRLADPNAKVTPPPPPPPVIENPFPAEMTQEQADAAGAECAALSNKAAVVKFGARLGLDLDEKQLRDALQSAIALELTSRVK